MADWVYTHLVTCGTPCHAALIGNNAALGELTHGSSGGVGDALDSLGEDTARVAKTCVFVLALPPS